MWAAEGLTTTFVALLPAPGAGPAMDGCGLLVSISMG